MMLDNLTTPAPKMDDPKDGRNEMDLTDQGWGIPLQAFVCEACDWAFLVPAGDGAARCPHCSQGRLTRFESPQQINSPELLIDFSVSSARLEAAIRQFAQGIPFAPQDLSGEQLRKRLTRLFLPMWLVDSPVKANWKAEAGFDYQVVSHQEKYEQNRGAWSSQQVQETRIRWAPRLGRLDRSYLNLAAPALEQHAQLQAQLGLFDLKQARPYQPEKVAHSFVRLPNRSNLDAWNDVKPTLQSAAAEECRQASAADHIRQFSWQPNFGTPNWTLLLLPVYSSYYLDDEGVAQQVLIHGQTGVVNGDRRASLKRASKTTVGLLITAIVLFVIGLLLATAGALLPPALALGFAGIGLAFLLGFGSLTPLAVVWWFNRNQKG